MIFFNTLVGCLSVKHCAVLSVDNATKLATNLY
jgi:hypothetical protein